MEIRNGTWNQEAGQLQKRAKAILAMGRVERVGDRFFVATPNLKGRRKSFEVCRNEHGQVVCECPEFDAIGPGNGFRCEHIIAVKFALVSHNTDNTGGDKVREANSRDRDVIPPVKTDTESRESGRGEQEPPRSRSMISITDN